MRFQNFFVSLHQEFVRIMLKFGYYNQEKELDRAWFDSSNVVYGECDDSSNTQEKTVVIVFKNGSQYQYSDVNIGDWLDFKASESQGKALNSIFKAKGYQYKKLDELRDLEELENEFVIRSNNGVYMEFVNDESFKRQFLKVTDCKDNMILYTNAEIYGDKLKYFVYDVIQIYKGLGNRVKYTKEIQELLNDVDLCG